MDKIVGFSNSNTTCSSSTLSDLELAKQDLINHFRIAKGEKWTNPDFDDEQSITLEVELIYIPLSQVTTLIVQFDRENPEGE